MLTTVLFLHFFKTSSELLVSLYELKLTQGSLFLGCGRHCKRSACYQIRMKISDKMRHLLFRIHILSVNLAEATYDKIK